jgi:uncharacterized protein
VSSLERVRQILETSPTIAVLGIHTDTFKPAHYVPAYLSEYGYRILGVNPAFAGRELFGSRIVSSLSELTEKADMVDVFRRPSALPGHLDELIAYAPRVVWFQLGIRNDEVARKLAQPILCSISGSRA